MTDEHARLTDAIFQRALDVPAASREEFVRRACGDDARLLAAVMLLLRHDPGTEAEPDAPVRLAPAGRYVTDPHRIGPYRVLQRLGAGGFGVVYEVEQLEPIRRRLALKVLKAGMDSEEVLARFEAERQALALMDHPNIARVYDAGVTEQGRPYFAMELVKGDPITLYCDREKLDLDARIELFVAACRAVQHAHQKGILHRDLKPSNILVTRVDGEAAPKVIDFGIAKALTAPLTSRTLHTITGQVMGTPAYMSPEQSEASGLGADTATDVFSLGVVFYELLCGRLPVAKEAFDGVAAESYGDVVRRSRRQPPSAHFEAADENAISRAWWRGTDPWHLRARLRGDLDWIVMRAIASDRSRRYQSVQELIEEIGRFRADEPVHAGPPGVGYRARKFARRHRVGLAFLGTVLVGLIAAGSGLTWALVQANEQRQRVERAQQESEAVLDFLVNMLASARPSERGTDLTVREILDEAAGRIGDDLQERPLVEGRLRAVVGTSYRELGLFSEAMDHLHVAHALLVEQVGEEAPATLSVARDIGVLHRMRGDYAAAESTLAEVLRVRRTRTDVDPAGLVEALDDLASVYVMAELDIQGIPLFEEALALAEVTPGIPRAKTADILSNLGLAYQATSRFDDAERALVRAHRVEAEVYGPDHPYTRLGGQGLGSFYRETGQLERAEPFYRDAYGAMLEIYGPENPTTLRTRSNFALLLSDLGRYDEALEHTLEVVRVRESLLGPDNPATLASQLNLALLHQRRGDLRAALEVAEPTIERARRTLGDDHLYTLLAVERRGVALRGLGRAREAEPLLRDALERAAATLGDEHWRVARMREELGTCLLDLGRDREAEALLLEAHAGLDAQFGGDDDRTRSVARELMRLYEAREDFPRRDEWRRRAGV